MVKVEERYRDLLAGRWRAGYSNSDPSARTRLWHQAREDVKRAEAEAIRTSIAREQAERESLRQAIALGDGDLASLYTRVAESIAREHSIRIEWRETDIPSGSASWITRTVVVPRITGTRHEVEQAFSVFLHEAGHILAGRCGGGDHQPDPAVKRWHHCLRCEQVAWERAMELWPFNLTMFERLRYALGTYQRGTAGPETAKAAVDRQRSTVVWMEDRLRRANYSLVGLQARHAWALLSTQEKFDRRIAAQRESVRRMRAQRSTHAV